MHHLALETIGVGKKKLYAAKVWVKPRLNFKDSQEFKSANDVSPTIFLSILAANKVWPRTLHICMQDIY